MQNQVVEILKREFGKEPRVEGKVAKLNVEELDTLQIYALRSISIREGVDLLLKRSGTGIIIIVTAK